MNEKQISLLAAFLAAKVEFAVVGGLAVNAHGYVRATNDMDLFIRPTEENARRAHEALLQFGAPVESIDANDLLDNEENVRLGPAEDHIDILNFLNGVSFDQVWRNRVHGKVAGMSVPFISKSDLIECKRQVGRHLDLADIDELMRVPDNREFGSGE